MASLIYLRPLAASGRYLDYPQPHFLIVLVALLALSACAKIEDCLEEEVAFITQSIHDNNHRIKLARVPRQILVLRSMGITADDRVRFEVFFYADSEVAVKLLTVELAQKGYYVGYGQTLGDDDWMYTIEGSSPQLRADVNSISEWVSELCEIAYQFDVQFEDWYFKNDPMVK